MFLFSKKLLLILVAVALVFGGELQLALAEKMKCWKCGGPNNVCDAEHSGASVDCVGACGVKIDGNAITKYCETEESNWMYQDMIICFKGAICHCFHDDCNKPKTFGVDIDYEDETSTTTGSSLKNGAGGTRSSSSTWMIMVAVAMMMVVGPSVFIAQ